MVVQVAQATQLFKYSSRIIGAVLPPDGKPILIPNVGRGSCLNLDAALMGSDINLEGIKNPFVKVDLPTENGTITPEMARLLGIKKDMKFYVITKSIINLDPAQHEGLRRFVLSFQSYWREPGWQIDVSTSPWSSDGVPLLGSAAEAEGHLSIPGVDHYVQPEMKQIGNWWQNQLYAQQNGLVNYSVGGIVTVAEFVRPENPNERWLKEEVERFEKNGQGLLEEQVTDLYRQLRRALWRGTSFTDIGVVARELLALPFTTPEDTLGALVPFGSSAISQLRSNLSSAAKQIRAMTTVASVIYLASAGALGYLIVKDLPKLASTNDYLPTALSAALFLTFGAEGAFFGKKALEYWTNPSLKGIIK